MVNAPGDPVAVVYGLLNPDHTEQYIRVGRSFLTDPQDPGKPPVTDSTIWNLPVTVYMEEWVGGLPVKTISFEPTIAPAKDTGYFPSDNLRLFKAEFKPTRLSTYRLYVHFPDDDRIITGATRIPGRPVVYDPLEIPGRKINLQDGVQFTTRWAPGADRGVFQGFFTVNYLETVNEATSYQQIHLRMDPVLGLGLESEMSDYLSGNRFLDEVAAQVRVLEGAERSVINVQYLLFKGGEELALMVSPDLQQTTISSSLNQYTNLVNAIGLFSSIQQVAVNNLELSNTTLNELAHSELTGNLGFRDIHGGELNPKHDE